MRRTRWEADWLVPTLWIAVAGILAGCQAAPQRNSPQSPPPRATVKAVKPSQTNAAPATDDCGLAAYPVSRPTKEILAAVPRSSALPPNSDMLVKLAIDPEGRVTHLRVLRLWHPEAPQADAINAQAIDSIKRWHYAPTKLAGEPVTVCSDVAVTIDF